MPIACQNCLMTLLLGLVGLGGISPWLCSFIPRRKKSDPTHDYYVKGMRDIDTIIALNLSEIEKKRDQ